MRSVTTRLSTLFPENLVLVLAGLGLLLTPIAALADSDAPDLDGLGLAYYLPTAESDDATTYDESIPTPADVFGFQPGQWHVRHDQLLRYMEVLAEASDRVTLQETGRTHEGRGLLVLTITSAENHARLEQIHARHFDLSNADHSGDWGGDTDTSSMPAVVYMGYSVHGNEASGSNAAPVVAYYLAAGRGETVDSILDDTVVLLDPSLNPDGLGRFAQWVNGHRGKVLTADPQHREHNEPWPSGRTNHYWFDLNRDWLLAQHPESRARLATFHRWRPNVLTDFHEMGTDSTFFFQPGVDSRKNPLTPQRNVELTQAIAEHHAAALDDLGALYYTRETFDDYYYGKGSTYPDIQGAIGILFEQASSRGHMQESENGPRDGVLTFPFAVRNQVTASLSTLRAAVERRVELLDYQRDFYLEASRDADSAGLAGWVVSDGGDPDRLAHMAEVLAHHGIETRRLERAVNVDGHEFAPASSLVVPLGQRQSRLATALFETRTEFLDDTFYDVSTWTLPYAFGLPFAELDGLGAAGDDEWTPEERRGFEAHPDAVAYAVEWHRHASPRALNRLQRAGVRARATELPLRALTDDGLREFERGTVLVHLGFQDVSKQETLHQLARVATEDGLVAVPILGGLTTAGPDLGSPSVKPLKPPRIAVLSGGGLSSYEVGQAWHLLDERFGVETTLLDVDDVPRADLDRYTHLVLVHGWRFSGSEELATALKGWVRGGGVLLAIKGGAAWATENLLAASESDEAQNSGSGGGNGNDKGNEAPERKPYADFEKEAAKALIGGTIFDTSLDLTHPLAFGYRESSLPVFKNSRVMLEKGDSAFTTVAAFTDDPLLSGYVSDDNAQKLAGTPAVIAERLGGGAVVRYAIDPTFRAVWYGTERLFLNAVFLSDLLERRPADEPRMDVGEAEAFEAHGH